MSLHRNAVNLTAVNAYGEIHSRNVPRHPIAGSRYALEFGDAFGR
jgi:hypothetical protein